MPPAGPFASPPPSNPYAGAMPQGPNASPPQAMPPPRVAAGGSTITCPRCATATPANFAYCQQCGLHLNAIAPTDPGSVGGVGSGPRIRPSTNQPPPGGILSQPVDVHGATLAADGARGAMLPSQSSRAATQPAPPSAAPAARASGAWGAAVLVNRDGTDGQRFALTSEDTVIGRAGADIAFDDDRFLARQHARIERTADGNVKVHPIDTTNGVFKKTEGSVELVDGAIILVGREVLRFERVAPEERTVHPLVRHGVALFGSPPRDPWGRIIQLIPSGGARDIRHLIGEEIVLGREEGEIIYRDDAFMSRRHAAITWNGSRALLTDLGSSNGTFVRLTGPTAIKHGDHVRVGDQLLRIER
jgi:pSer/pThr/pTyr-binding forkhead associated (FHA) protein